MPERFRVGANFMRQSDFSRLKRSAAFAFSSLFRWSVVLSLAVVAISSAPLRAAERTHNRSPAETRAPAAAQAPVITFDEMFFDFGKIRHAQTVIHSFKVSNTGTAPLHLKEVKAVCGCTSTVTGKMELAPGESTEIDAAFTPESGITGAVRKTIMVTSDDPAHPKLTLRFAADVLPAPSAGQPTP
jgi:hypothetical protein